MELDEYGLKEKKKNTTHDILSMTREEWEFTDFKAKK